MKQCKDRTSSFMIERRYHQQDMMLIDAMVTLDWNTAYYTFHDYVSL
jgi:hypothetical protein